MDETFINKTNISPFRDCSDGRARPTRPGAADAKGSRAGSETKTTDGRTRSNTLRRRRETDTRGGSLLQSVSGRGVPSQVASLPGQHGTTAARGQFAVTDIMNVTERIAIITLSAEKIPKARNEPIQLLRERGKGANLQLIGFHSTRTRSGRRAWWESVIRDAFVRMSDNALHGRLSYQPLVRHTRDLTTRFPLHLTRVRKGRTGKR